MLLIFLFSFFLFSFSYVQGPKRMCREMEAVSAEHATERRRRHCDHIDQKKRQVSNPRMTSHAQQGRIGQDKGESCKPYQSKKVRRGRGAPLFVCTLSMMACHMCVQSHVRHLDPFASQLAQQRQRGPISASTIITCVACYSPIYRRARSRFPRGSPGEILSIS
jgi:hypothetical protein